MLVSILANLVMEGGVVPPVVRQYVDTFIEDKGGSDGKKASDIVARGLIKRESEDFLLIVSKFITEQN